MDSRRASDRLIQDHTLYAFAAGAIPVPLADVVAVAAIQLDLVRALARTHSVEFDAAVGKGLISAVVGASAARAGASALKAIPGLGLLPASIIQAGLSGASTYAVGHLFRMHFENDGELADLDPETSRSLYESLVERGSAFVRGQSRKRQGVPETAQILERLVALRDRNAISDEEFEGLKAQVFAG